MKKKLLLLYMYMHHIIAMQSSNPATPLLSSKQSWLESWHSGCFKFQNNNYNFTGKERCCLYSGLGIGTLACLGGSIGSIIYSMSLPYSTKCCVFFWMGEITCPIGSTLGGMSTFVGARDICNIIKNKKKPKPIIMTKDPAGYIIN